MYSQCCGKRLADISRISSGRTRDFCVSCGRVYENSFCSVTGVNSQTRNTGQHVDEFIDEIEALKADSPLSTLCGNQWIKVKIIESLELWKDDQGEPLIAEPDSVVEFAPHYNFVRFNGVTRFFRSFDVLTKDKGIVVTE